MPPEGVGGRGRVGQRGRGRVGGDEGTRTLDPLHAMQVLSQLSYIPAAAKLYQSVAGTTRSRKASGARSRLDPTIARCYARTDI